MKQNIKSFSKQGKWIMALLMALVLVLAGCGSSTTGQAAKSNSGNSASKSGNKALVVYFSRTGEQYGVGNISKGNTAIVADMIAQQIGADEFELVPEKTYPTSYNALTRVAQQERNNNERPKYKGQVPDLSKYDTIFIGAPVWWGDYPMIVYTFLENNKDALAGKRLVPFNTNAGSGLSGFDSTLKSECPNSTVATGLAVAGTDAQNNQSSVRSQVNSWLKGLGY